MSNEKPTEYVVGLLFTRRLDYLLLIKKNRPEWQQGRLNGIGGKVENDESPEEAIRREFEEETGLDVKVWSKFVVLKDLRGWNVHFFLSSLPDDYFFQAQRQTDEELVYVIVSDLHKANVIPNLRWLIPMALNMRLENATLFTIEES